VFVVYLSGSDTRSIKLATSRSDVNILAFVNPKTKQVLLLNTPRDYYVSTAKSSSGAKDKLTHCGLYGVDCSMDTLGALYDTSVDYYMQVNFEGFKTLVDAIGGIEVDSDIAFTTTHYDVQINKGTNYLDGEGALGFVRERYAFSDGDNARGRNTMKVVKAIINKVTSGTTLLTNYSDIMKSMEGMFVTNMSSDEISSLVKMQLSDMSSWDIRSYAVTGTDSSSTTYSTPNTYCYVMVPNESSVAKAKELIDKMESGEELTDADFE
jgi:LCP family protein required for cell wall assembly